MTDALIEDIGDALITVGTRLVMEYLVSQVPFLGLYFVNPIVGFFVGQVIRVLIKKTEFGVYVLYVDHMTKEQVDAFKAAADKNKEVQVGGTPEEKKQAQDNLVNAARDLIRIRA